MNNIGMILDNEFTGDMRVENEVISLQKGGFKVYVLCLNHGNKQAMEDFHGATIIRFPMSKFLKNKLKPFILSPIDYYTKIWIRQIKNLLKHHSIDFLHVHDLYMLPAALSLKKNLNVKIIADLHENFPAALRYYKYANQFPGNIIISKKKWDRYEVKALNKCDKIITVIEEAKKRYIKIGIDENKILTIPNYVNIKAFLGDESNINVDSNSDNFVLLYTGGFDAHRGLETVIYGMSELVRDYKNLKLILVGTGKNEGDLKSLVDTLGIRDYVSFEGWQKPKRLPEYIMNSTVCLIPHLKTIHTDNTIPHKLFQYMLLGKTVLSSNCSPLERIIKETNCGLIYESANADDFVSKVKYLINNKEKLVDFGERGRNAVLEQYRWLKNEKKLIEFYSKMEKNVKV